MSKIATERHRQSMTQKRLAFEAGIDARTLRKIEKGEQVSPESYRAVCRVLGVPATKDVVEDKAPPPSSPLDKVTRSTRPPLKSLKALLTQPTTPKMALNLSLVGGMLGCLIVAYQLVYDVIDQNVTRDVHFVVESEKLCEPGWGDALVPRVAAALPGVDLRGRVTAMGTYTCEIRFTGKTELTGDEIGKRLADARLKSRIEWARN